jgi:hypothetical protein
MQERGAHAEPCTGLRLVSLVQQSGSRGGYAPSPSGRVHYRRQLGLPSGSHRPHGLEAERVHLRASVRHELSGRAERGARPELSNVLGAAIRNGAFASTAGVRYRNRIYRFPLRACFVATLQMGAPATWRMASWSPRDGVCRTTKAWLTIRLRSAGSRPSGLTACVRRPPRGAAIAHPRTPNGTSMAGRAMPT